MSYANYLKWKAVLEDFENNWHGSFKSYCRRKGFNYVYLVQLRSKIRKGEIDSPDKVDGRTLRARKRKQSEFEQPVSFLYVLVEQD